MFHRSRPSVGVRISALKIAPGERPKQAQAAPAGALLLGRRILEIIKTGK
jgi:hypothetical protein